MPIYGTTDRCAGGTATADSDAGAGYVASKAFDNVYLYPANTAWISANTNLPHWIKYDFGAGISWKISQVKLYSPIQSSPNPQTIYQPKSFTIQGSNNDADWVLLNTQTNLANWTYNEVRTFSFLNKNKYRYIKINVTATEDNTTYAQIAEIEMFEGIYPSSFFLFM